MFGVKPEMIIKGGFICASRMGDANASIPTPQPLVYTKMFGAHGLAVKHCCATFTSKAAAENGLAEKLKLERMVLPVSDCRKIGKSSMLFNNRTGSIDVDPETYRVKVDGVEITCEAADELPLAQRYYLF